MDDRRRRRRAALLYVFGGTADLGGRAIARPTLLVLGDDGDEVAVGTRGDVEVELLVLAGAPLRERIARWGPFVMTTRGELRDAFEDLERGRFGTIAATLG